MNLSVASIDAIKLSIKKAIKELRQKADQPLVTDIYLQPDTDSGALAILDDNDEELAKANIQEWTDLDEEDFYADTATQLRNILQQLQNDNAFEHLDILKPYSFLLIDDDTEIVEDLLLIDDDLLIVNSELLKGLDDELDGFLKHLLED